MTEQDKLRQTRTKPRHKTTVCKVQAYILAYSMTSAILNVVMSVIMTLLNKYSTNTRATIRYRYKVYGQYG